MSNEEQGEQGRRKCCATCRFEVDMATGYSLLGSGRGPVVMSNIFLSSSLIYLASEAVGCTEEVWNEASNTTSWQVVEDCNEQVYGAFRPAALITNIAVISGLLSAILMPVIGAIVDYTPHRWTVGVVSAILIILIQGIQIGTGSATWFAMSILQAIVGFFYQVQVLAAFSYLPDIAGLVGEKTMIRYSSAFTMIQFSSQAIFLVLIIGPSMSFGWDDVMTARVSQAVNVVTVSISFYLGWKLLPKVGARHTVPEGKHLLLQGFKQNWDTVKQIQRDYKKSLRWYMLALIFAEATASAFTVVSVVFLSDKLGFSGAEIGIFFFVSLMGMIPGGKIGSFVTSRTNPNTSWKLSMLVLFCLSIFGALVVNKENAWPLAYVWGFVVGLTLGWFYPTEKVFFSLIVPKGQEAELAGFFVYCSQIIAWLPPLIFSVLVENDVDQGIGVIAIAGFAIIAILFLSMAPSWEEIVGDVRSSDTLPGSREKQTDSDTDRDETSRCAAGKRNQEFLSPVEVLSNESQTELRLNDDP